MERYFINQTNNTAVVIGGIRVLSEFTTDIIVVTVYGAQITVTGTGFKIARFDENEIEVTGKIENVETTISRKRAL